MDRYIEQLLAQDRQDICPQCYHDGRRKPCCRNMVVVHDPDMKLVCCWFGDKPEISAEAFALKLRQMGATDK